MKITVTALSIFLVLAMNVFASSATTMQKVDMEKMATAIERRTEKLSLKKWEDFSNYVDLMEADVIGFSKSTKSDPKDVMVDLLDFFEERVKDLKTDPACTNIPKLNERCAERTLRHFRYKMACTALQTVLHRYVKLQPMTNKGEPTTLP